MDLRPRVIVPWIVLFLSVCGLFVTVALSFTSDRFTLCTDCEMSYDFFVYRISRESISRFQSFVKGAKRTVDIMVSTNDDQTVDPNWAKNLVSLKNDGVNIRIYSNREIINLGQFNHRVFPDRQKKHLKINFAVVDGKSVLIQSNLVGFVNHSTDEPAGYSLVIGDCKSLASELKEIFEMFWTLPNEDRAYHKLQKKRWVPGVVFPREHQAKSFNGESFRMQLFLTPDVRFPVLRDTIRDAFQRMISRKYDNQKIFTSGFFIKPSNLSQMIINANLAAMLEEDIRGTKEIYITDEDYNNGRYTEMYESIALPTDGGRIKNCTNRIFDGSLLTTSSTTLVFASGIGEVFYDDYVTLGFLFDAPGLYDHASRQIEQLPNCEELRK